jgi:hypothetical protein
MCDQKFTLSEQYIENPCRIFLKNYTGWVKLQEHGECLLCRFSKSSNGFCTREYYPKFKQNVKSIESKDFENFAEELKFIFY